jgi:hypothetical protein
MVARHRVVSMATGPSSHQWNRKMCNEWWRTALSHPAAEERDGLFLNCHPLTQLAWSSMSTLPTAPCSLAHQAQVIGRFNESPSPGRPALLPFPGPGVINSAARTFALHTVDWGCVRRLALSLERGNNAERVVDVHETDGGVWTVNDSALEYVIAKALVDQLVMARPVIRSSDPVHDQRCIDHTKLYAHWRRAGLACPERSVCAPSDGWHWLERGVGPMATRMLDPAVVMSSRDLEPVLWPKAWHFSRKLDQLGDGGGAFKACFGEIPVRWVPATGRWMTGHRHRVVAAMLAGVAFPATTVSGSPVVTPRDGCSDASLAP